MKAIYVFLCLVFVATLNAAVPDYKAFRGVGGVTVTSNPPNGTIVIDGSGISAGALPTYAITNRNATVTFTNLAGLRQEGGSLFSGSVTISSAAIVISDASYTQDRFLYKNSSDELASAPDVDPTEFSYLNGLTANLTIGLSNSVRVTAGSGITVTPSGSGGIMTYQIAATGSGTPAGSTADIQFNEGGVFAGTNRLRYVRADNMIQVIGTGASQSNQTRAKIVFTNDSLGVGTELNASGISLPQSQTFQISSGPAGAGWGTNIYLIDAASLRPAVNDSMELGSTANRWEALWVARLSSLGSIYTTGYVHSAGAHVATEFSTTNATPGSTTAALTLSATNLTQAVRIQGAHQMTRLVTNIVGILEVATNDIATSVFTIDCDKQHEVNMTNRIGFAFTAMITNGVPGQRIKGRFIGTASGGANHIVTFAGQGLFLNSYDISANPATSLAVTVTNGYLLEYDIAINKDNGTNTFDTIYAYKKY